MRTVLSILLLVWSSQAIAFDREVCFTPSGQCTGLIVQALEGAKETVLVQAYSFTSAPIAKALTDAHNRGVDVRVILDKSQKSERYSELAFLRNAGIPVWIDYKVAIAHNKVMVIDGEAVITGSFNFTKAAQEKNAENVLILRDRELAKEYADNWQSRLSQSVRYEQ
jgi:phosphatidylserine/phosphatidylglycerophosphate/cardiolipin synthase-like enzyme